MKLSTIGQQKGDLLKQVTPLAGLTVFSIHDTSDTLYIFQNNLSFYPPTASNLLPRHIYYQNLKF